MLIPSLKINRLKQFNVQTQIIYLPLGLIIGQYTPILRHSAKIGSAKRTVAVLCVCKTETTNECS